MARSKSSNRWLTEHFDDHYVRLAQKEGWRSRAAYKLLELDQKNGLLGRGMTVVDLGAAPGGWSQVAVSKVGREGRVVALDILPMEPIQGVEFLPGDFREDAPLEALENVIGDGSIDLVLSDMAPNISGVTASDQAGAMYLAELALDFAVIHLKPGGDFVVKLFQGDGFDDLVAQVRSQFGKARIQKPAASRPRSREVYLVARDRKAAR